MRMERPQDGGGEEKGQGILSQVFPSRSVRPDDSLTCNNPSDVDEPPSQHWPNVCRQVCCGVGWGGGSRPHEAPAVAERSKFSAR